MKTNHTVFLVGLSLLPMLSGCVGTGPNTQQGAVGGAALGALAGAIIGNNSGGHNGAGGALIGALVGGVAGGTLGNNADHERGTLYQSEAEATTNVVVQEPPPTPAPRIEVITPRPSAGMVWIDGYWGYAGRGYVWFPGYWIMPPPRHRAYVTPHWVRRGPAYVYVQGYWR